MLCSMGALGYDQFGGCGCKAKGLSPLMKIIHIIDEWKLQLKGLLTPEMY
jgi:hypothetical protein